MPAGTGLKMLIKIFLYITIKLLLSINFYKSIIIVEDNIGYSKNLQAAALFFSAMNQNAISKKYVLDLAAHVQLKQTKNI